jgi:AraC-like DNA-binding protein
MNAFLAAYLLFANLHSLAYYTIFENENAELAAIFAVHFTPFYFLTLPFLHLYIISHRKEFKFRARYFLLLVPFFVALTNISPFFLIPFSEKIVLAKAFLNDAEVLNRVPFLFSSYYQQSLVRPLFNLIFILFTIITYYRERQTLEFQKTKFNEQNFVLFVLIFSFSLNGLTFLFLLNKLLIAIVGLNFFETVSYNAVNTLFSYLSAGQNLLLLFFPQIMFREQVISEKTPAKNKENGYPDDSIIPYERLLEIDQIIKQYNSNHPYLTKGFTITKITLDTGIPSHQISLYYKNFLKTNFNDWKNKLRIEYAVSEIKSGNWSKYTIEKITDKSGFSSRSNFNKAFIASMNQTPSEFLKELKG